jgi:hypothetical protein
VFLTHREIQLLSPLAEELAILAVLVSFWIALLVLLPQQHESQILVGDQLVVQDVPVWPETGDRRGTVAGWIEEAFEGGIIQMERKWPGQLGHQGASYGIGDSGLADAAALGCGSPALAA